MLIEILNKVFTSVFFLSILNVLRHLFLFIQTWYMPVLDTPNKYKITKRELFLFGLSIAYILSTLLTGIKI
jgi:hypothetical protein